MNLCSYNPKTRNGRCVMPVHYGFFVLFQFCEDFIGTHAFGKQLFQNGFRFCLFRFFCSFGIFPLCHRIFFRLFPILSLNVHATTAENGTIMITFSIHSVVSCLSPFTVSQMPQPPITSDNGFIHRFRFNRVLNRIIDVTKVSKNSFRKNTLSLNF